MRHVFLPSALLLLGLASPAVSATEAEKPRLPTVELTAEASVETANDLAVTQAYFEASGNAPGPLATEVNQVIAEALKTAKAYPQVKVKTAGTYTGPVYGRNGRSIEAWRMRSSLSLESRDMEALSQFLGKIQGRLAVSAISFSPAPETRRAAEDAALVQALANFEARAQLAAKALGKRYRVRQVNIGQGGGQPPMPIYRAQAMAAAEAAPAPLEAGQSSVTIQISGSVELLD